MPFVPYLDMRSLTSAITRWGLNWRLMFPHNFLVSQKPQLKVQPRLMLIMSAGLAFKNSMLRSYFSSGNKWRAGKGNSSMLMNLHSFFMTPEGLLETTPATVEAPK